MLSEQAPRITDVIGAIPYRMAFAGGWIDQPFVSEHNPDPPGSMVVVGLEPTFRQLPINFCAKWQELGWLRVKNPLSPYSGRRGQRTFQLKPGEGRWPAAYSAAMGVV